MKKTYNYYKEKLSARKLQYCYEIAPPRVKQYLQAEINFVIEKINNNDLVLELGCGYGRVIAAISQKARFVIGIDLSIESLNYGQTFLKKIQNFLLIQMDATKLAFPNNTFDAVICVQNGIAAFNTDQQMLVEESVRVTKPKGIVLFSTYSKKFWKHRLEWFRLQSQAGLIGEIDNVKTTFGKIVCRDGFASSTVEPEEFLTLVQKVDVAASIIEVDESSLFCEMIVQKKFLDP